MGKLYHIVTKDRVTNEAAVFKVRQSNQIEAEKNRGKRNKLQRTVDKHQ